jgi:hypothetical protein
MTIGDPRPALIINYSPQLDLRITFAGGALWGTRLPRLPI